MSKTYVTKLIALVYELRDMENSLGGDNLEQKQQMFFSKLQYLFGYIMALEDTE